MTLTDSEVDQVLADTKFDEQEKELTAYVDVLFSSALIDIPYARRIAWARHPLGEAQRKKVERAVVAACVQATTDPGVVLRFGCDLASEVVYASELFRQIFPLLEEKGQGKLIPEKSSSTRFELDNDSAILVVLNTERK